MSETTAAERTRAGWRLGHSFAEELGPLAVELPPSPPAAPGLVALNDALAGELGLDPAALKGPEGARWLSGAALPPGARPLAQAYSGHQYGHFTTLGDGRALLLGEQRTPSGATLDVQLKGSGRTPFSRGGDGRAVLGPMLRELLLGEGMHALGIPTTRGLAVAATGEAVYRQRPMPGAVLARVAASHVRVGTFQHVAARRDPALLEALGAWTLRRHHPDLARELPASEPSRLPPPLAVALLRRTCELQAALIARWQEVGFVHGVMNTDNVALSGETIDYGPCAFMEAHDPATVFSSIDRHGRYAYGNQPAIAQWNLVRFAETLLPLLAEDEAAAVRAAEDALGAFGAAFEAHWRAGFRAKLGLADRLGEAPRTAGAAPAIPTGGDPGRDQDDQLIVDLLAELTLHRVDHTNAFAALADALDGPAPAPLAPLTSWLAAWRARLEALGVPTAAARERLAAANPTFIPRNHLVEEALTAAEAGDLAPFEALLEVVRDPYARRLDPARFARYREPSPPSAPAYVTYCGT